MIHLTYHVFKRFCCFVGGNRANTIHYVSNNQLIQNGDMVLMDAGCEYHGYTSDITRTWPINGTYTCSITNQ